jgi:hypothetical protein
MVGFCVGQEQTLAGPGIGRLCFGCHDPTTARLGETTPTPRGVTCLGCHDVDSEIRAGGNADLAWVAHDDWVDQRHASRAHASLERLRQPEFCGGCHRQFVPGTGLTAIGTLDEYQASSFAGTTLCVDCHMTKAGGIADHRFPGGNVYLGRDVIADEKLVNAQMANLAHAVTLTAVRVAGGVQVTVANTGVGHGFPTGVTDIREPWVAVQELDGSGADAGVVATYGGPLDGGLLPANAARLGTDIAAQDGGLLLKHELTEAARVPFDVRVPPGEAQSVFVPLPGSVPANATLEVGLYYHNVRTTFYQRATDDAGAHTADVLVAQARVSGGAP